MFYGGNVLPSMMRLMFNDLTLNQLAIKDKEMNNRCLRYAISRGNPDLWPDLRSAMNGAEQVFFHFFDTANEVLEGRTGATANRHGMHRVLTTDSSQLVSTISALHSEICHEMDASCNPDVRNSKRPSEQLLRVACCPQNESRAIARNYWPRLPIKRAIIKATMQKNNPDSHYNHKINQLVNCLVHDMNDRYYKVIDVESWDILVENSF